MRQAAVHDGESPLRHLAFLVPFAVMLVGSRLLWDPPGGVMLDGAIHGAISALIAVGLAVTYRANRIVNFAQADLGAVPANLTLLLFASLGWNIYVSAAAGLAAAVVLGVLVEFLFIRRFFKAPRLILTVATIGVTQILVAGSLLLPKAFDPILVNTYPPIIDRTFEFGAVAFDGNDLLTLLVVPAVLAGLAAFFRFSAVGVALRGSAESADRAAMLGIPVKRLQSVVWGLAAALAFVALFLRMGVVGSTLGRVLEPSILLTALGAAVIGRMERLPTIVASAVGLGVVSTSVKYGWDYEARRNAVLAVIIGATLLLSRARRGSRLGDTVVSTWQATREVRPIPAELRHLAEVKAVQWALGALLVAGLAVIPLLLPESRVRLTATIVAYAIVGLSLVVLTGWAGQVSLGQMAVVGLGGACASTLATRYHWDLVFVLIGGGLFGALVMVIVGLPTLRARGLTFAVMTLALALVTASYLLNPSYSPVKDQLPQWTSPGAGRVARPDILGRVSVGTETRYYVLTLAALALALVAVRGLRRSRTGRVLISTRENERAAQAYGIGFRRAVVTAFAISGFLAGLAGALLQVQAQALDLSVYSPEAGLRVFSMVVVGGLGSMAGALLGAVYVRGVEWFLPGEWSILATGVGLLLVLMLLPGGLGAALGDVRDAGLRRLARRKNIRVPSLVADTRVDLAVTDEMVEAVREAVESPLVTEVAELHQ